jgi:hypothetical protein
MLLLGEVPVAHECYLLPLDGNNPMNHIAIDAYTSQYDITNMWIICLYKYDTVFLSFDERQHTSAFGL